MLRILRDAISAELQKDKLVDDNAGIIANDRSAPTTVTNHLSQVLSGCKIARFGNYLIAVCKYDSNSTKAEDRKQDIARLQKFGVSSHYGHYGRQYIGLFLKEFLGGSAQVDLTVESLPISALHGAKTQAILLFAS